MGMAKRSSNKAEHSVKSSQPVTDRLPERFSPSRVSTYMQCPAKFFYQTILKMPQVPTAAQLQGTLAHEAIERVFDLAPEDRTPEATAAGVRVAWERISSEAPGQYDNLAEQMETILDTAERMCKTWFYVEDPTQINPESCEMWVRGEVGGMPMHGIIDRLDRLTLKDGREVLVVSDYKSAVKVPKEGDRFLEDKFFGMRCYAAMLADNGQQPAAIRLVFISGMSKDAAIIRTIDDRKVKETQVKIKSVHADIKKSARTGEFACKTGPLCNWCELQEEICPAFNSHRVGLEVDVDTEANR